jgi:AcrR family transcriptional regulator
MLPSMTPPRGAGRRLTADNWVQAGFALLADGGPNALRIDRLCARLDVTKGSFYWHFTDMPTYRAAVVVAWGGLLDQSRRPFENMPDIAPRERLEVMMRTMVAPEHFALERAMRVWALTDESVLAAVQRSDQRVQRAVWQTFLDHGFDPEDAGLRAAVVFATGLGLLHATASAGDASPELLERFLDFMFRQ